jgi:hypothetical protein
MSVQFDTPVSQEVMNAMAIALRTDACHAMTQNPEGYWHVDAGQVGYTGFAVTKRSKALDEVMASTKHLVLSKTRAYQGVVTPVRTCCLEAEYNGTEAASGWSLSKAQVLASKGDNAAKILQAFYPDCTVELADSFEMKSPGAGPEDGRSNTAETADAALKSKKESRRS